MVVFIFPFLVTFILSFSDETDFETYVEPEDDDCEDYDDDEEYDDDADEEDDCGDYDEDEEEAD